MPIILKEDNKELVGNEYEIPKEIQTHLQQTLATYPQYRKSKGFKRLNSLVNPSYNKRSDKEKYKDGKRYMTWGDMEKLDHEFRHMSKNPNDIRRVLNGGEEMADFVSRKLKSERTRVKPVSDNNRKRTLEKNAVKPYKNPTNITKLDKEDIHIKENKNIKTIYITEGQIKTIKNLLDNTNKN